MPHDGERGVVNASSRSPFFVSFRVSGAGMVGLGWFGAPSLFFSPEGLYPMMFIAAWQSDFYELS